MLLQNCAFNLLSTVDFYSKAPQPHRWIGWTVSFAMAADYIMTPHYTLLHIHCSKSSSIGLQLYRSPRKKNSCCLCWQDTIYLQRLFWSRMEPECSNVGGMYCDMIGCPAIIPAKPRAWEMPNVSIFLVQNFTLLLIRRINTRGWSLTKMNRENLLAPQNFTRHKYGGSRKQLWLIYSS